MVGRSDDEPGSLLGTYFHIFTLLYTSYISLSIFELVYHFHLAFFRLFQIFLIFLYLILVTFSVDSHAYQTASTSPNARLWLSRFYGVCWKQEQNM